MNGRQRRYRGGVAATIVLVVAGLLDRNGTLLLAAAIPLAYVAAGSLSRVRVPSEITARRTVEPTPAPPGTAVTVTLTVKNASDRTVPDLRVVDGVPGKLAVLSGTPRGGTALGPGEELRVRYRVVARRGDHEFDPPEIRVRGPGGAAVATRSVEPSGENRLGCRLDADAPPIARHGEYRTGAHAVDRPGWGVAFHSTREHHPDDPADRIDWRHYAKRGSLTTVNYERRVDSTVVLVLDARAPNRVVAGRGHPTAVELGAYAATHALGDLLGSGHDVGVAVVGVDGPGPAGLHWVPPAGGRGQRVRGLDVLREAADVGPGGGEEDEIGAEDGGTGEDGDTGENGRGRTRLTSSGDGSRGPGGSGQVRQLVDLAPPGTQFALFSPLLDDRSVGAVETWRTAGLPVVVLSPDVVPTNTVSGQYEQVRRRARLARCQATGARTVDWRRGAPLALVLDAAFEADVRRAATRVTGSTTRGTVGGDG